MQLTKTIKVIQVVIDGQHVYVKSSSCLTPDPVTLNPSDALDYTNEPYLLKRHMDALVVPGDAYFAKSGLRVDGLPRVVVMEVTTTAVEISNTLGRVHHE